MGSRELAEIAHGLCVGEIFLLTIPELMTTIFKDGYSYAPKLTTTCAQAD